MDGFESQAEEGAQALRETIYGDEGAPADKPQHEVHDDVVTHLGRIVDEVGEARSPEKAFSVCMSALSTVEQKRFVIQNLLESVKGGRSLSAELTRYNELGLIDYAGDGGFRERAERDDETGSRPARFLAGMLRKLGKFAAGLIELICRAVTRSERFVGIRPSVGFSAAFPSVSFSIEPDAENLGEFFASLADA